MKTTKVGPLFVYFITAFLLIRLVESMFHASSLKALFTQVLSQLLKNGREVPDSIPRLVIYVNLMQKDGAEICAANRADICMRIFGLQPLR
jgi:hypothetical protein